MKNRLRFHLLLFSLLPTFGWAQQRPEIAYDSLSMLWEQLDTVTYYALLRAQVRNAGEKLKDEAALDRLITYLYPPSVADDQIAPRHIRTTAAIIASKYYRNFHNLEKAEYYYLVSHQHAADSLFLDDYAWYVENDLMNIYNMRDDYEKAGYYFSLVDNSLNHQIIKNSNSKASRDHYSRFLVNKGLLLESRLDTAGAMASYTRGLRLADSINLETGIQANACQLSRMMLEQDKLQEAKHYISIAEGVVDSLEKEKNYKERLSDMEMLRARIYFREAQIRQDRNAQIDALNGYRDAIGLLREYHNKIPSRDIAKYMVLYAEALIGLDSLDRAEIVLSDALGQISPGTSGGKVLIDFQDLYHENTFREIFSSYAKLCEREYQMDDDLPALDRALESLDRALFVNNMIIEQVVADPSKLLAIRTNKTIVHRALDIAWVLYQQTDDTVYLHKARSLFNRSKSLLLDEKLKQNRINAELTAEEKNQLRVWQLNLKQAYEARMQSGLNQDSLSRVILIQKETIRTMLSRYDVTRKTIPLSGSYIEYAVHGNIVMAYYRLDGKEGWSTLGPRSQLRSLIERMNIYLSSPFQEDPAIGEELYQFLIAPLTDQLPDQLSILPDEEIAYIPFDMLAKDGRMLIMDHTIVYAHQFLTYENAPTSWVPPYEICLAAPSYETSAKVVQDEMRGSLYPLLYAQAEVDSISALYGRRAIIPHLADDNAILDSLRLARIFHFAGHAVVRGDEAFLALSSQEIPAEQLSLEELSLLGRGPELVVLSACETGLGKLEIGEGILSLGRSFAEAGAESVMYSLWNVKDQNTSQIMVSFYKHLKENNSVPGALRKAKLAYISAAEEGMEHPYFWAGFVVTGN